MPNPLNVGGVVGTDNISPIYNPDGRWQVWNMKDIYLGTIGRNKHVPKIEDVVMDITGNTIVRYVVKDINPATMVPELWRESINPDGGIFEQEDVLIGVGPGQASDTYRVFLDKSVTPFVLNVDRRLYVHGTMCRWCKIFQGSDVSTSGKVISRIYDTSGNIVSENIPLELVANEKLHNAAIKAVGSAHTTADLRDGELVTAVIYDDNGHVVSKRQLLVENTAFIRPTDANARYIVGISMRSPFISSADPKTIRYPLNVPLEGLNLTGVVHFSNGDTAEYPVDGTRFKLMGFDEYVATQVGQTLYPVLKYSLGQNEFNYVGMVGGDGHIAEYYTAVTLKADGTYGVKLYPSLVWVDPIVGYRLKWWLYNLNRDIVYDVTNYVRINANYSAYDPIAYGVLQRLSVSINLRDVNPVYRSYVHTQTVSIVIERQGTERTTNWTLGFTPDQAPRYGVDVFVATQKLAVNNFKLRVDCKQTTQAAWLAKLYYSTKPLYDPSKELGPLEPTHFAIVIGATRTEYALSDWNATLTWVQNVPDYSTAHIQFIRKSGGVDLNLAVAGMPVYYVDQNWVAVV